MQRAVSSEVLTIWMILILLVMFYSMLTICTVLKRLCVLLSFFEKYVFSVHIILSLLLFLLLLLLLLLLFLLLLLLLLLQKSIQKISKYTEVWVLGDFGGIYLQVAALNLFHNILNAEEQHEYLLSILVTDCKA